MMFGLKDEIIANIRSVLMKYEMINRAFIFGSRARGDYKYNSDIDLALDCKGKCPPGIWAELDEAAGIYKIDVVDLNSSLEEKLRKRIKEQGVEIYSRVSG
jgi:predicted nucleotidyltransferase